MNKVTLFNEQVGGYLTLVSNLSINNSDIVAVIGNAVDKTAPYKVGHVTVTFSEELPTEKTKETKKVEAPE